MRSMYVAVAYTMCPASPRRASVASMIIFAAHSAHVFLIECFDIPELQAAGTPQSSELWWPIGHSKMRYDMSCVLA